MFFNKAKHLTIKFREDIDFFNRSVIYKTPIISVTDKPQEDNVEFFMAKDDEVAILLSKDLKRIGVVPTATDTYFIVRQINTRKNYNVFKLDRELFNVVIGRG